MAEDFAPLFSAIGLARRLADDACSDPSPRSFSSTKDVHYVVFTCALSALSVARVLQVVVGVVLHQMTWRRDIEPRVVIFWIVVAVVLGWMWHLFGPFDLTMVAP